MDDFSNHNPLELWGGVECTFNRVDDKFFNQLVWSGHIHRLSDLDLFADIGFRALRYPVIWEATAPTDPDQLDWDFADSRLSRLRELDIAPIAGLVHHGSGPRYANVASPDFAPGLARFAAQVAQRFPWIGAYTPVNEPLTTARFCGLYGHWHPHGQDDHSFVRILLNECLATALAMRAIREINPAAKLVQTDDLGRIYSSPKVAYQAFFENERRWLSFDLLCGRVDSSHIMWRYLLDCGASPTELDWFCENPCPPDVLGINHYPTSDRYLEEEFHRYPSNFEANNGIDNYADLEAVRVLPDPPGGFMERLSEAWDRYGLPLAITETHLGCSREEQLRWLAGAWSTARELKSQGVAIRAVTAWALLGTSNWNSLVTRESDHYEPGAFDVRSSPPRPTAIAGLLHQMAQGEECSHPVLDQLGWWQRSERILDSPPASHRLYPDEADQDRHSKRDKSSRALLILGNDTAISNAFARACDLRGLPYYLLAEHDAEMVDVISMEVAIAAIRPWAVINTLEFTNPQDAPMETAAQIARICAQNHSELVCFSSDQVFDGRKNSPYHEDDFCSPINAYGRGQAMMEKRVLASHPQAFIVRTGPIFGAGYENRWFSNDLDSEAEDLTLRSMHAYVSPTYLPDLVDTVLDLMVDGESGVWHLANRGCLTWGDFLKETDEGSLWAIANTAASDAEISKFSVLGSLRGNIMPSVESALERFHHEMYVVR